MIWSDNGYLLSKNKYGENSVIAEFFTENHGKISGIIYGATSKKIRNYLQLGNKFYINYNSKTENKVGYFKVEVAKLNTPHYLDDKIKLSSIIYAMNLIKLLTAENQSNLKVYTSIEDFYNFLSEDKWIKNFILWELNIFKNLGYHLDFKNYAVNTNVNGVEQYVVKTDSSRVIPNFLVDNNLSPKNKDEIIISLRLIGDFLEKTILKPNNINIPLSRKNFLNLLI